MHYQSEAFARTAGNATAPDASTNSNRVSVFADANSVTERNLMDGFLSFLSDLILFTAGILVLILWVLLIVGIAVESYDAIRGEKVETPEEDLEDLS